MAWPDSQASVKFASPKLGFVHMGWGSSGERQGIGEAVEKCARDFDEIIGGR